MSSGNGASKRARIISFKLPSLREQQRRRGRSMSWHAGPLGSETFVRSFNFLRYCLICSVSLFKAMAPWALAVCEAVVMLLLYFVMVPDAVILRKPQSALHYSFKESLEDVLLFSLARDMAVILAYAFGAGAKYHRTYMWTAYALAAIGTPFCMVKLILFHYSGNPLPAILLLIFNMGFTAMHIIAAQNVVRWARKRYDMGLGRFGYPWEESDEAWLALGSRTPRSWSEDGEAALRSTDDVPPAALADPDSRFVEVGSLKVHYKEACISAAEGSETGIVLMHGYGGGAFSWRHVLGPLARSTGCRVIAFDRPAFGLTSRPRPPPGTSQQDSPYSMRFQTGLTLALCSRLGLRRVLFVGHSDGALLALLTTAVAADLRQKQPGNLFGGAPMRRGTGRAAWQSSVEQTAMHMLYRSQSEPPIRTASGASLTNRRLPVLLPRQGVTAVASQPLHGSPPPSEADASPSEPSTPDSRSRGSSSSQLTVVIVAPRQRSPSTVTEEDPHSAAELGLLSPMLSPRAASSSSADKESAYFSVADVMSEFCGMRSQTTDSTSRSETAGLLPFQPPGDPEMALGDGDAAGGEASDDIIQELRAGLEAGLEGGPALEPLGLALLHPSLAGEIGPSFTRILGKSRLGRKILRPLLRSEIGVVSNRRAWHDASKLTQDVLEAYQRPLCVQNWDTALAEVSRLKREVSPEQLQALYAACARLPALVATGAQDGIVSRAQAGAVAADLSASRTPDTGAVHMACIPQCGHLSHEEAPDALLQHLTAFADQSIFPHRQQHTTLAYSGG